MNTRYSYPSRGEWLRVALNQSRTCPSVTTMLRNVDKFGITQGRLLSVCDLRTTSINKRRGQVEVIHHFSRYSEDHDHGNLQRILRLPHRSSEDWFNLSYTWSSAFVLVTSDQHSTVCGIGDFRFSQRLDNNSNESIKWTRGSDLHHEYCCVVLSTFIVIPNAKTQETVHWNLNYRLQRLTGRQRCGEICSGRRYRLRGDIVRKNALGIFDKKYDFTFV